VSRLDRSIIPHTMSADGEKRLEKTVPSDSVPPTVAEANVVRAPEPLLDLPVVSNDNYESKEEVARGGMGRILSANDRRLGRPVALKELHEGQSAGRFIREALVTARLQHPSIVPVYEAGYWPNGRPFYAMKMVSGQSLDEILRSKKTLAERLALLPHVIAVAEAVAYAHNQRIIHRDLKPANILVGPFGETVVVDWGLAKDLLRAEKPASQPPREGAAADSTVVGTVLGTPQYMSPEQARGETVDARTDVYALGAILYYVLGGAPPYKGMTAPEAVFAAASGPPEALEKQAPEAPEELVAIVRKAMAHDPSRRYPTAGELAADLRRFETGQLVSVHSYSGWELVRRWVRRHKAPVLVGTALGAGLLASLVLGIAGVKREARRAEAERDKARLEAEKAERINGFVQDMLGSADPRWGGKDVKVAQVLDAASSRASDELRQAPEIQAAVQLTIAGSYQALGQLDRAEALVRTALSTLRGKNPGNDRDVAKALVQLAGIVKARGQPSQADPLYRQALATYHDLGLDQSLDAALAKGDLASDYQALGRSEEAEKLNRESLSQKRALLGSKDAHVAVSLNNLGVVLGVRGDWASAEPLHREALAIMREIHGPEHMEVAAAERTLATVLEARGKFDEAGPLFKDALAQQTKLLGADHPETAWTRYNYAYLLWRMGKPDAAAAEAREVLKLRGNVLPESHPIVAAAEQVLGLSLLDEGRPKEALGPLRDSLALREGTLPRGHWLVAVGQSVLGYCLARLGRFQQSEDLLLPAYDTLKAAKNVDQEKVAYARTRLVALYEAWGKPEKAAVYKGQ
jgi:tetratricopeptide (TPR) repeat protein